MKIRLYANCTFEAENIDAACKLLADHFRRIEESHTFKETMPAFPGQGTIDICPESMVTSE